MAGLNMVDAGGHESLQATWSRLKLWYMCTHGAGSGEHSAELSALHPVNSGGYAVQPRITGTFDQ